MKSCIFELVINILTYAIKNREDYFSKKDFKNVVYTEEFENFDINEKITFGFEYLLKRGLLNLKNDKLTYYESYCLPNTIKINMDNDIKVFKDLSKKILLMHEGKDVINDTYEIEDDYADILESVSLLNSGLFNKEDKKELKITLSKILVSIGTESKSKYSLLIIIQLLSLKSFMNIKIKNKNSEFAATNLKFTHIQFNTSSLMLYFDKCSFEIDDINSLIDIESIDKSLLSENINKSLTILGSYPFSKTKKIIELLEQTNNQ